MEPVPETIAAFDELDPAAEAELRTSLTRAGQQVRALVPDCIGLSIATVEYGVTFTLVASAVDIAVLDAMQYLAGGPCVDALASTDPLEAQAEDFAEQDWQLFAQATAAKGVQSTLTLPILVGDRVIGSVNLYAASRRAFGGLHDQLAEIFGAWAGGAVTNADLSFDTRRLATEAPGHLKDSSKISTAVGVICAQLDVDEEQARRLLRDAAACAGASELRVAEALLESWHEFGGGAGT
ncbi:GAF domain-containing protein [Nocardioides sp. URHA0020]|uniref:GAF domain-containing protein n=1 Tax=Nocardioides sp. URHA0020 TaxID=1380392 RepID=UPI00048A9489